MPDSDFKKSPSCIGKRLGRVPVVLCTILSIWRIFSGMNAVLVGGQYGLWCAGRCRYVSPAQSTSLRHTMFGQDSLLHVTFHYVREEVSPVRYAKTDVSLEMI